MAIPHGKNAVLMLGSVNLSPYLNSIDLSLDEDTADTTVFGATWKTAIAGTIGGKVEVGGYYDPAQSSLPTLLTSLVPGVLSYCPSSGTAIGDRVRLVSAFDVGYAESSPVGGVVAVRASFMSDAVVGFGDVLHPLGEDTNTTTGATKDDTAATSTGWTAHLHVTAVDAGSWVVKLQDATASNFSDGADVTGGAFTAATGATSQRLLSAAITTDLRRYVRYVATRTGGSVGDGITFFLGYSRNR